MHQNAAKPSAGNEELVQKAKVVLAQQKQAIQRALAALADTQEAIARLEQRRFPPRKFGAA